MPWNIFKSYVWGIIYPFRHLGKRTMPNVLGSSLNKDSGEVGRPGQGSHLPEGTVRSKSWIALSAATWKLSVLRVERSGCPFCRQPAHSHGGSQICPATDTPAPPQCMGPQGFEGSMKTLAHLSPGCFHPSCKYTKSTASASQIKTWIIWSPFTFT